MSFLSSQEKEYGPDYCAGIIVVSVIWFVIGVRPLSQFIPQIKNIYNIQGKRRN